MTAVGELVQMIIDNVQRAEAAEARVAELEGQVKETAKALSVQLCELEQLRIKVRTMEQRASLKLVEGGAKPVPIMDGGEYEAPAAPKPTNRDRRRRVPETDKRP